MNAPELIRKKRDGGKLTRDEIEFFITGYLSGSITDYQVSALLMTIFFQKMNFEETAYLTEFILRSGVTLDLSKIPGLKVGKHSTGGVGDKVTIILGPMVAACGVTVPLLSGRGLGHTGGTLDKLESIPGYRVRLSADELMKILSEVGVAIMGQTDNIAPADMKLYALRDVTATVDSIPLIASSIMSKKIAEGIDALVLDVKTGKGAVMANENDSAELADMLTGIGSKFSKRVFCFITNMDEPLGYAVGNWLEIAECIDCLNGKDVPDLMELTYALGGAMVMLGNKAPTIAEGIEKCKAAIRNGSAWNKFLAMVKAQGGDLRSVENMSLYPKSKYAEEIHAPRAGWISAINALEIGLASHAMGAGRTRADAGIDPKAGILLAKKIGDTVAVGELIATCYSDDHAAIARGVKRVEKAFGYSGTAVPRPLLLRARPDDSGRPQWAD